MKRIKYLNFFFALFLINIFHLKSINSFYIFPFKYLKSELSELYKTHSNISKEEIFLNYTNSLSLYTLIQADNSQILEIFFDSKNKCTSLLNDTCATNPNNEIISKEKFLTSNLSKIFDSKNSSNICVKGVIGLALPGYTTKKNCSYITEKVKESDSSIKKEVWSIKYFNPSKKKEFEGQIIIGIEPHEYEPSFYNESNYKQVYNHINEVEFIDDYDQRWAATYVEYKLKFEKVFYYKDNHNHIIENEVNISFTDGKEAVLDFNIGMIKCPSVYLTSIKENFFKKYIDSNACQEITFSDHCHTLVCDKGKLNVDIKQFYESFPILYFYSFDLNYTFVLEGKDLFLENNNKIYFMIFTKNERIFNWRFGEIFLKKYFFTYNQETKKIGFYDNNINQNINEDPSIIDNSNNGKIKTGTIILIIGIFLLVIEIVVAIIWFKTKRCDKNRRKRANELSDDNYDYLAGNNSEKINQIINDD